MNQRVTVKPQSDTANKGENEVLTPSKEIVRQANQVFEVTDSRGRVIGLKKPSPLARIRFIEALGESSSNRLWTGIMSQLMYVCALEGNIVTTPISKPEMEILYQRLDEEGMDALAVGLAEHFKSDFGLDIDAAKK
jgi:hypothetical protein